MKHRPAQAAGSGWFWIVIFFGLFSFVSCGDYPKPLHDEEGHEISFYQPPESAEPLVNPEDNRPRNVVLCIGDGMGANQVQLARLRGAGIAGRLWMERMPITGLMRTHNAKGEITDSAAAITAILCGQKTENGRIGQTPDGVSWLSIARCLQAEGRRIGAVVTCTITHATPAGLFAHVPKRSAELDIALQILEARPYVLLGGGWKYWLPESEPGGEREDGRNLLAEARRAGYQVVANGTQMEAIPTGPIIGLFQEDALTTVAPEPSLAEMARAALRLLTTGTPAADEPFFLLVEGSQIDWACHLNNKNACVRQTLLFDMAVKEVLDFAAADRQTLVLVTADHETGGLTLVEGGWLDSKLEAEWSTGGHSAADVPIFAFGPGAEHFAGVLDNTELAVRMARLLGVEDFPRCVPDGTKPEEKPAVQTGTK